MMTDSGGFQVERVGHRWSAGNQALLEELLREHGRARLRGGLLRRGASQGVLRDPAGAALRGQPPESAPPRLRQQTGPHLRTRCRTGNLKLIISKLI